MFEGLVKKVFGTRNEREIKRIQPLISRIGDLERTLTGLSDDQLAARSAEFRTRIDKGESLDQLLPEAFAVCRDAGRRVLGMRHYDVQLVGGTILHRGAIAEMRTGEGKTLTATLAMYLNGLTGKGAHLITVNDYLAARDAEWMGRLYGFLGLSTGTIVHGLSDAERQRAYACDITYGTNNEFGFDYLRDNMKYDLGSLVQRGLNFAIVDEVDSILIDEARTPLIISGQADISSELYTRINDIIAYLVRDEDYIVDEEHRTVSLTDEGIEKIQDRLGVGNLYEPSNVEMLHHVNKALEAHTLYKRDEQYLVRDQKVIIIDEFTGRAMDGRRWSDGLHQAVEAKEGVPIQNESVTMATVTYQNFFRMYDKLAGMTGTAMTEEEEFGSIYKLSVYEIPTNKPVIRKDQPDLVYRTEGEKFAAIVDQILACHEIGQPVLVGTTSVDKSDVISRVLRRKKIHHEVLNAKFHEKEAEIVAQAGRKGAITIATNMAGRGTDILLGGNPEFLARREVPDENSPEFAEALERYRKQCAAERQEVLDSGGLFILGTERHDSRRIDNQLRGRAGRQGDPGESRFFLSLEDELMRRFGADRIQGLMARLGMEDGVPIEADMVSRSIEGAQRRVEGRNFDIRKNLLEYDEVLDKQRTATYALRRQILKGEDIETLVLDALEGALVNQLNAYANPAVRIEDWDINQLQTSINTIFDIERDPDELPRNRNDLERLYWQAIEERYRERITDLQAFADRLNETYKDVEGYEPRTGMSIFLDVARKTYLQELDNRYRDHLRAMRALRDQVGLHAHAQKDPKQIYKKEGYDLFNVMRADVLANVSKVLMRVVVREERSVREAEQLGRGGSAPDAAGQPQPSEQPEQPRRVARGPMAGVPRAARPRVMPKVGRNEPCWCGSGKKYKHCHMATDTQGDGAAPGDDGSDDGTSGGGTPGGGVSLV